MCDVFPWEHSELLCRELVNSFDPKIIVDFAAGSGLLALASARHCKSYVGFCRNAAHVERCRKNILAHVLIEIIEGTSDGFAAKRFLSQQRSLGGSTEAGSEGVGGHGSVASPRRSDASLAATVDANLSSDDSDNAESDD